MHREQFVTLHTTLKAAPRHQTEKCANFVSLRLLRGPMASAISPTNSLLFHMSHNFAFIFVLLMLASGGCATRRAAAYSVVSTHLQKHSDSTDLSKIFHLDSDLHGNGWVMRRGTRMTFNSDGSALLETTVYAHDGLNLPNAIQLESIQYGPDGNIQFSLPGNDVGHSLHLRHARRDYPYTVRFGYKRAYFPTIQSVKFACRLLTEPIPPIVSAYSGK